MMNQTNLSTQNDKHEQDAKDLTRILPASKKVYVEGSRTDIQVPFRQIDLTDTQTKTEAEANPSILVYDTSGVYTDPNVEIDLNKGLPRLRERWIDERGDTEELPALTSEFGRQLLNDILTQDLRFAHITQP